MPNRDFASEPQRRRISPKLIHGLSHPVRRELLRLLNRTLEPRSAQQMSGSFVGVNLSNIAYHLRVLQHAELVKEDSQRHVRGALEKFVVSLVPDHPQISVILSDTEKDDAPIRK